MEARENSMEKLKKTLLTLLVVAGVGGLAGFGAYSAFSSTTTNSGNQFAAGTVTISDNDSNNAAYSVSAAKPGDFGERCIKVTYSGSLTANVKMYRSGFTSGTGLDSYVDLS